MTRTTALEWNKTDQTNDGRFYIQSELVRGESRFYWLVCRDEICQTIYKRLDLDGSYDKRTVKRQAQRIADLVGDSS